VTPALLVVIPIALPLITASLLLPFTGRARAQRAVSLASGVLLFASAALTVSETARGDILVLLLGAWSPDVGIVWVADGLSAVMLLASATVSLASLIYASGSLRVASARRYFYPLHQLLLVGVDGSLLTGDFFNLFVFFEIMLLSSFALMAPGRRAAGLRAVFPYVLVSLVASALFLISVGAIYGAAGTVNMAELSVRVASGGLPVHFNAAAALLLVVLVVKTGLFPVFMWLPDSYPAAPIVVNGLFAGLLTKVGVYALFRAVPLVGGPAPGRIHAALVVLASITMLVGVLGALGRDSIRGVLSFHIVSQVGYMIFGLGVFTPIAVAAGLFHAIHNMIAKTALIFAGGIAERAGGTGALYRARGLARPYPWVAAGFFVSAISLSGLPPFSGFWGKWFLVIAGFQAGAFAATAISLLVGLLTLASMLKLWNAIFWGEPEGLRNPAIGRDPALVSATLWLSALTVVAGVLAAPIFAHLERVAAQIIEVAPYVDAVRGAPGGARGAEEAP
jgi:multicomponent Na+:H+ antiporter subunit D